MVGDYRGSYSRSSDDSDSDVASSETTSSVYSAGKEWTDEKHSLYLKSMEASFVDQLYNSLGALAGSRKPCEEQFKVLRDGFWQRMNVKQPEYRGGVSGRRGGGGGGGAHEFLRSPWIKHYKPSPKMEILVTDELENQVVGSSGKKGIVICSSGILREGCSHSRDHDQISIGEEVSDQNFVNEVTKGENGSSKKMKTVMSVSSSPSSSTDQVVPLRKAPANMT
jgi:hypothetical protein